MRGFRTIIRVVAAAAAVAVVMLSAVPASAGPPHVADHYDDVFDVLVPTPDDPPGSTFCGLVDVPVHGEVHGYFSIKNQGNSDFPYFADRYRLAFTYTNPLTGLTFTVVTIGQSRDLHVVDNGDGTVTVTAMSTGVQKVYGPDGELLFTDRGLFRNTVLIDTNGTIDPSDDEFIADVGDPFIAGPHDTAVRDFCDDFLLFTTP